MPLANSSADVEPATRPSVTTVSLHMPPSPGSISQRSGPGRRRRAYLCLLEGVPGQLAESFECRLIHRHRSGGSFARNRFAVVQALERERRPERRVRDAHSVEESGTTARWHIRPIDRFEPFERACAGEPMEDPRKSVQVITTGRGMLDGVQRPWEILQGRVFHRQGA